MPPIDGAPEEAGLVPCPALKGTATTAAASSRFTTAVLTWLPFPAGTVNSAKRPSS